MKKTNGYGPRHLNMEQKINTKKNILFLPSHEPSFNELFRVAEYLKKDGRGIPRVLIPNDIIRSKKAVLSANNIDYIDLSENGSGGDIQRNRGFVSTLKDIIKSNQFLYKFAVDVKTNIDTSKYFLKRREIQLSALLHNRLIAIKKILLETNPESVVVTGDRHQVEGWEPALLRACRELDIPTVIPPVSFTANIEGLSVTRRNRKDFRADNFRKVKAKYPKQYIYDDVSESNIFFYPPSLIDALAKSDMLPENPWVMGGGHSTFILADGEETKERYIRLGCKQEKIIITGHPVHDNLYSLYENRHSLRNGLNQKYGFAPDKKLIIIALPQLAEHGIKDWKTHWDEIRFLCDIFSLQKANCLISLHPKMKYDKYKFIEDEYNIPISKRPLSEILPAADIFAATFSSTIQWAVLCQIPSIVFDFYGFNYTMYDYLIGTTIINKKNELPIELEKLIKDKNYYDDMAAEQRRFSGYISPFDGKCMERIVNVILRSGVESE